MKRRNFLKNASLTGMGLALGNALTNCAEKEKSTPASAVEPAASTFPVVVATWNFQEAVAKAREVLENGKPALDAVEQGVMVEEANADNQTVGLGGLPDRDGHVTLDASIMDHTGNCGSVVFLENIVHAVSVARKVMEDTPHVMLAGKGAEQFAYEQGFPKTDLLTEASKKAWEEWKVRSEYKPVINIENHDTIGMLAIDRDGNMAGACTTSGLAFKMHGRVGDSPIIGSGMYVDNEVGGAVATGMGEEVVKTVGCFLVVELMRQGKTPQEACEEAVRRIVSKPGSKYKDFQVAYVALNKKGVAGYYAIHSGFSMTRYQDGKLENFPSGSYIKSREDGK